MNKQIRWLGFAVASLGALLSGCSSEEGEGTTSTGTEIRSFSVTGTDGTVSSGGPTVTIATTQNGGVFRLQHSASAATRPYRIDWYISTDAAFSPDDEQFFGFNCDVDFGDCAGQVGDFTCRYTSNVETICQEGRSAEQRTLLQSYFNGAAGLPGSYFLIFRVCDGTFRDCIARSVPATWQ